MTINRMSQAALDRCRRLVIRDVSKDGDYTCILEVHDPRIGNKIVASYRSRTTVDTERVRRAYMKQFRVPEELVSLKIDTEPEIVADTETPNEEVNEGTP